MSFSSKALTLITFTFYVVAITLNSYFMAGNLDAATLIFCLFGVPFAWWIGKIFAKLQSNNENLQEKYRDSSKSKMKIEQIIDTVEDIAIFSVNQKDNHLYVSKGIEQIYGLPHKAFISDPDLWRKFIHPDDQEKITNQFSQIDKTLQAEFRIVRPDDQLRWVVLRAFPSKNNPMIVEGNIIDISDRKQLEEKMKKHAYYDDLTNLPNRKFMERQSKQALARSKRHEHDLSIMFIDLDGFKKVNDTLGHEAGDDLLKEVSSRLNEIVRDGDFIARLGGDEFLAIFEETNKEEVEVIADRIVTELSQPYLSDNKEAKISPSIGISMFPKDGEEMTTLIKNADKAMYYAKSQGKANYQFYTEDLPDFTTKKETVINKIVNRFTKSQ